jgi:hypothetical protein
MSAYPEHDKLIAVRDRSQAIGAFLDTTPYVLCELDDESYTVPRYMPISRSITSVLASYFGIDLTKIEAEKQAMLDSLRSRHIRRPVTRAVAYPKEWQQ